MKDISLKIFGARGSTPVSGQEVVKYGGNTSCFLLTMGEKKIILDCGTGLNKVRDKKADILISHMHFDHIMGLITWGNLHSPENEYRIFSSARGEMDVKSQLNTVVCDPYWPVNLDKAAAKLSFVNIDVQEAFSLYDDIKVSTILLNHPNTCVGYKISYMEKNIVYMLDHEFNGDSKYDNFVKNADILICDSFFLDTEYDDSKKGWGHSTIQGCIDFSRKNNVKKTILAHHAPFRTDDNIDRVQESLSIECDNIIFAREGEEVVV